MLVHIYNCTCLVLCLLLLCLFVRSFGLYFPKNLSCNVSCVYAANGWGSTCGHYDLKMMCALWFSRVICVCIMTAYRCLCVALIFRIWRLLGLLNLFISNKQVPICLTSFVFPLRNISSKFSFNEHLFKDNSLTDSALATALVGDVVFRKILKLWRVHYDL